MDALKKFLNKKKTDKVFKSAGPGHKLTEGQGGGGSSGGHQLGRRDGSGSGSSGSGQGQGQGSQQHHKSQTRTGPSGATKEAAAAALARLEKQKKPETDGEKLLASRQMAFIKEQARKELEEEKRQKELKASKGQTESQEQLQDRLAAVELPQSHRKSNPEAMAVSGVFFTCSLIGPEILTKEEIEENIKEFLLEQPEEELGVTSCLLIHSCNKPFEKVTNCVETICKYLDNIINQPQEQKFRKIRCSNQVFQNKVAPTVGAEQFLRACGFKKTLMKADPSATEDEEFWVYHPIDEETVVASLTELRDTLKNTTPIKPELDRNVQVLMPVQVKQRRDLPEEFYTLTAEEVRREQISKSEQVERELTLRTKAMKERDELREQRMYRYAIMRIRFPDGFTLQGTFKAHEKLGNLYDFVKENLVSNEINFELVRSGGDSLSDLSATLAQLKLAPSSILNFKVDSAPAPLATGEISFLNAEVLALVSRE